MVPRAAQIGGRSGEASSFAAGGNDANRRWGIGAQNSSKSMHAFPFPARSDPPPRSALWNWRAKLKECWRTRRTRGETNPFPLRSQIASVSEAVRLSDRLLAIGSLEGSARASVDAIADAVRIRASSEAILDLGQTGQQSALVTLGLLRALANERRIDVDEALRARLRAMLDIMSSATYGVAIWRAGDLDALAMEQLFGLLDDLSKGRRWVGCELVEPGEAELRRVCIALTGQAPPSAFGEQAVNAAILDPVRLLRNGDCDLAVAVTSFAFDWPEWVRASGNCAIIEDGPDDAAIAHVLENVAERVSRSAR